MRLPSSLALNSAGLSVLINVAALAPFITIIQGLSSWRIGEQIRDKLLTSHDDFFAYFRRTLGGCRILSPSLLQW